jgi:hypothetical protein
MAISLIDVSPGDLITSAAWNNILKALRDLDVRLAKLEASQTTNQGKLAIKDIYPLDLELGKELHIVGLNFGLPTDDTILFDGIAMNVTFKQPPSGDQILVFDVPTISLTGDSQPVVVTVSNVNGFDSRQITVRKPKPTVPDGSPAVVKAAKPPTGTAAANGFYVFTFTVDGSNNLEETYTLRATPVGNVTARMVTDVNGGTDLFPPQVTIAAPPQGTLTTTATVFVRVDIPQGATGPASVQLTADSQHNATRLSGSSSPFTFQIGQLWPGSPTINFQRIALTGPGAAVDTSTGVISFTAPTPPNSVCSVTYRAQGTSVAQYTAKLSFDGGQNGWTASLLGNPLDPKWPLLSLPIDSHGATADIPVFLLAAQGAGTATFVLTMTADANPTKDQGTQRQIVKPKS